MDDFDKLVRHADFGKILELAGALKEQQGQLVALARGRQHESGGAPAPYSSSRTRKKTKTGPNESQIGPQSTVRGGSTHGNSEEKRPQSGPGNRQHPNQFDGAAELIRATLITSLDEGPEPTTDAMGRGECDVTDSLIDETIKSLADELKLCLDLKRQLGGMHREGGRASGEGSGFGKEGGTTSDGAKQVDSTGVATKTEGGAGKEGGAADEKANPVPSKFSKQQTDVLLDWMIEHREHPFPTHEQTRALAEATNLSVTQVVNWTTNVRKRNLKATVEREKKPHHFIDYLFLATDREKKLRQEHPGMDFSFLDNMNVKRPVGRDASQPQALQGHATFQQPPFGHAPPRPTRQYYQQSDIHRQVPPPRAPRNTGQIFRRGNQPSNVKQHGCDSKNEGLPTAKYTATPNEAQLKQARERERILIREYAPYGIADIPPDCFDENDKRFANDEIGENMFNAQAPKSLASGDSEVADRRQTKAVSFESTGMADAPLDENAEDYLMKLIAD